MPSEIASCPDTESTSTFGRKLGDTRSGPRSRSVSACSRMPGTPPIADPKTIPTRSGSNPLSPASVSASRPAATPSSTLRSSFRASFGDTTCVGSNPFTSPATRTGSPSVSKVEIQPIPLSPASAARHVSVASSPSGVTAPTPVIATRVIEPTLAARFSGTHGGHKLDMDRPGLVYFHSKTSGRSRRVEGYLAQVLQRRRNHDTFKVYAVAQAERPDLI